MFKLFPHPVLSVILWIFWLLLNNTVAAGHLVLGLILAILIPFLTSSYWPEKVRISSPAKLLKFLVVVIWDIVISNLVVAKLILSGNDRLRPAFLPIVLDIQTSLGISILANTISLTPGTVSCDLSEDRQYLLVHSLHVEDVEHTIKQIKERYEAPLKEIFTSC